MAGMDVMRALRDHADASVVGRAPDEAGQDSDSVTEGLGPSGVGAAQTAELHARVLAAWEQSGSFSDQTLARCGETAARFLRRQQALGYSRPEQFTDAQCADFVAARGTDGREPGTNTMHARRTAIRMLMRALRELGYDVGDPTLDLRLPPRTSTAARPLTDLEVTLCRTTTRLGEAGSATLHRAVAWALGESSAVSSEISAIRLQDLDDPVQPHWVQLPGTRRHEPRAGELTDWGSTVIARQAAVLLRAGATPSTLLTYRGAGLPGQAGAQAAVCNALAAVLKAAGLATEPDVRPTSLRNWAGRRLYDAGVPIEEVARRLGNRSLDAAAEDIALTWRRPR